MGLLQVPKIRFLFGILAQQPHMFYILLSGLRILRPASCFKLYLRNGIVTNQARKRNFTETGKDPDVQYVLRQILFVS